MRKIKKQILGFALSLAVVAGMLHTAALAADCTHEELKKGVCQSCETQFEASYGETLYKNLEDAIAAAAVGENHGVVVLTDLKDETFTLGEVYLAVVDKDGLVFENCNFVGEHEKQVIYNAGGLILKNVAVENTAGAYALYSEWTESTDLKTLTVHGGEYVAKEYGVGLKQMQLQLESNLVDETEVLPKIEGAVADIRMEDSVVEVLCDLADTTYVVESLTPGVFAIATEYKDGDGNDAPLKKEWFETVHATVGFDQENRQWSLSGSIANAVSLEETEFTYNGTMQAPEVTAKLYGKTLSAEDYTVVYSLNGAAVEKPIQAGKYTMTVSGKDPYSESVQLQFEIKPATLTVASAVAESKAYDGNKSVAIKEVVISGMVEGDEVSVAVDGLKGEVSAKKIGTYDRVTLPALTLTGADAANYVLTQPTEAVATNVSIGKKTDAKLTVEVAVPTNGHIYNGTEIKPAVVVKDGEEVVSEENYVLTYENNVKAGTASVVVKPVEDSLYVFEDLKADFTIKPATLTVGSATATNKAYDGNKSIAVTAVSVNGVIGADAVSVNMSGVKGELANSKAAVYNKVSLSGLALSGNDAANYTIAQTAADVSCNVTVSKADVPAALADIKVTVPVTSTAPVVENLGNGMPADAGTLRYSTKNQDTSDGAKVIVLNWSVNENGKLTSTLAAAAAGDKVIYEVTVSSDNYKDTVVKVEMTLGNIAVDAAKLTVTPKAETLVYNGKEQHPDVEVKHDGVVLSKGTDYDVTYATDSTNVGEKELSIQFKGNYSGTATAKYTISKAKVTVSGVQAQDKTYDGTTKATVSATLSGVISGDDVKVSAVGIFANKNSGSNKTINVTYSLSGADAGNYELTATTGTTTAKITPVSASSLSSRISGLSTSNVTSANKSTLQSVVTQANAALEDTGLTSTEKTNLSNVKWTAEDMINRVESAASASATESVRKSADITKENVKVEDKAMLEKAQSDLNTALNSYGGNYTNGEKSDIQAKKDRITNALTVITRVQSAQILVDALPDMITSETVVDSALKNNVEDAQNALNGLSDYEKSLVGEDTQQKLTAVVQALENTTPDDAVQNTILMGTEAPEDKETIKLPTWILVIAVACAAICGGGLVWYKRKQEENEYNW